MLAKKLLILQLTRKSSELLAVCEIWHFLVGKVDRFFHFNFTLQFRFHGFSSQPPAY